MLSLLCNYFFTLFALLWRKEEEASIFIVHVTYKVLFKVPAHRDPVKRWNFRKADWKRFCLLTSESVERLPPPGTPNIERAYQDFCKCLLFFAKQCIPRGRRKNYVPCWDKECKASIAPSSEPQWGLTPIEPLRPYNLDRNRSDGRQEQWEEAVNSIDFSHSSRKAWRTINKLTGRSGRSSRLCPVSANSIA